MSQQLPFMKPASDPTIEKLIQDWEVPWAQGQALLDFALENLDLNGRPWMVVPIRTPGKATGYPLKSNELYCNLGSYSFVKKLAGKPYSATKIMDEFCFSHQGLKMLYSTTFLDESQFDRIYNSKTAAVLKTKYDPNTLFPSLYEKVVKAR
jgi:hypothetical protein